MFELVSIALIVLIVIFFALGYFIGLNKGKSNKSRN